MDFFLAHHSEKNIRQDIEKDLVFLYFDILMKAVGTVTIRNNECYIMDNHSTNRVFVNGRVLEAGVDTPLANGDRIRMGDEEFTVSIG